VLTAFEVRSHAEQAVATPGGATITRQKISAAATADRQRITAAAIAARQNIGAPAAASRQRPGSGASPIVEEESAADPAMDPCVAVPAQVIEDAIAAFGAMEASIESMYDKARAGEIAKLVTIKQKIEDLLPALQDYLRAARSCKPTPTTVALYAGKLFSNLSAIEAGIAAAGTAFPSSTLARVKRYKALLDELPALFDLPPRPPGR